MPRRVLAAASLLALAAVAALLALLRGGPATAELGWTSGGAELAGTLWLPAGEGPHPAAGVVPGHGDWTRAERLFRVHAERLARGGLAVLVYDKRGCGASTGDWRRASLAQLADDALGGVERLCSDPRLRADAVGLLGTSQGGLVAVLAASRSPSVAFVASLSLSTRSPAAHDAFIAGARVRQAGGSEAHAAAAAELHALVAQVYRAGLGWDAARAAVEAARREPWFDAAGVELDAPDGWRWRAYRDLPLDLDPLPLLVALDVPLFAAQGADDWLVPGPRAARVLEDLARDHQKDFTVVLIRGAGHTLRQRSGWPLERWTWPDAYWTSLERWLAERGWLDAS